MCALMLSSLLNILRIRMTAEGFCYCSYLEFRKIVMEQRVTYSSKPSYRQRGNLMFLSEAKGIICTSDIIKNYWIIITCIVEVAGEWFPTDTWCILQSVDIISGDGVVTLHSLKGLLHFNQWSRRAIFIFPKLWMNAIRVYCPILSVGDVITHKLT